MSNKREVVKHILVQQSDEAFCYLPNVLPAEVVIKETERFGIVVKMFMPISVYLG